MNTQKLKEMLEEIIESLEDIASDLSSLPIKGKPDRFQPGDLVFRLHRAKISEKAGPDGWMVDTGGR